MKKQTKRTGEILSGNKKINKITIIEDFSDKDILSLIEKRNIKPICLKKNEFSRFDKFSHQGIILDIEDFCYSDYTEFLDVENAKVVVLDHLEDPHNLGAIIRTCEAAGITGIIIPKDRSVEVNSTVMKTSAGAVENVKIAQVVNIANVLDELKENGFWVVGNGMSNLVSKKCDYIAKIPMYGKVNSLNASVAAGIMIYEMISLDR